ncbi:MAG: PAAR domain-containing protein [Fibrobacteria bacterium]|nr:PAAR domain-containing protein [Fibrobacteria bacterium]
MPGKPAARLGDPTAHGGAITGPGVPTVLIGKMPAATMGDLHVCPMLTPGTPPIPHVGGPITLGSTGVFIGKKPAARMGDMAVCVGPPSSVIMGCPTVMIGETSSGSQAGSAGAAAAAQAASTKGPKAIQKLEIPEPRSSTTESHTIDLAFKDASGRPMSGVRFQLEGPDGAKSLCCSSMDGLFRKEGVEKGRFTVVVRSMADARFSKDSIKPGDEVKMKVLCDGFQDGEVVRFQVETIAHDDTESVLGVRTSKVGNGAAEVGWSYRDFELARCAPEGAMGVKSFRFVALSGFLVAVSAAAKREPSDDKPIETRAPLVSM